MRTNLTFGAVGAVIGAAIAAVALLAVDPHASRFDGVTEELQSIRKRLADAEGQLAAETQRANAAEKIAKSMAEQLDAATAEQSEVAQDAASTEAADKPYLVGATRLLESFNANGVSANAFFNGRLIQVQGRVAEVDSTILGDPYVLLEAGDDFGGVQCIFNDASQLYGVRKGNMARVRGICGSRAVGMVIVRECALVAEIERADD